MKNNMKNIVINRTLPQKGDKKKFLSVYYDNLSLASKLLNDSTAFKIFLYLLCNSDKYTEQFTENKVINDFGVDRSKIDKAILELEEKGYLIKLSDSSYQFYETPKETKRFYIQPIEHRLAYYEDGTSKVVSYHEFYNNLKDSCSDYEINKSWENLREIK